ncbi:MAG TPA: DNA topoisomerase IV subunit B [Stellaceae bacterium]|nr:DNA topoisomerase IV subunit B [Stellaceae bacterium]
MPDLFDNLARKTTNGYSAKDIEVLEGLEPVRRRPGMYIGGTDERALHHLAAEVLDNAMDEAVAGHASRIEVELHKDGSVLVRDNGRGIPVDPHPKFPKQSALEIILTMLHSGGKFGGDAYKTSGGLHGVGVSVVNALSDKLSVEVARDRKLWTQEYSRGKPTTKLKDAGATPNKRGTAIRFHPDPQIFGTHHFKPANLYRLARSKAYLFRGVEIRWWCDPAVARPEDIPQEERFKFPGGLADYLASIVNGRETLTPHPFAGEHDFGKEGRVEWAIAWPADGDAFSSSYCNTIPTPEGGTHESGLRSALTRALKSYGELVNNRRAMQITAEDVMQGAVVLLSLFIRDPQFQGQTKERLASVEATRLVDGALKDHFDHYLSGDPVAARALLDEVVERAEDRLRKRQQKDLDRKSATRKLRLPGKLADCSRSSAEGTEIFLVEGDSAGGSAKQARERDTQAILPLRGKILNVASASADKLRQNQEIADLIQALGCGSGERYQDDKLRYERVIIMTDADVDGAHIASLLMTFFFREMPKLVENGKLFLAVPPLYRLSQGATVVYARDDAHRVELTKTVLTGKGKIEISRFKGLGEMPSSQLRDTTMSPSKRTLERVTLPSPEDRSNVKKTAALVESLMGRKPELRYQFIQDRAAFAKELDV